ncbi:MAG: hypothetical protein OQL19_17680 [Gammaproteobacteria bacterium]|nr:hypothetical protein [Gammaproteobacteria bacterium]
MNFVSKTKQFIGRIKIKHIQFNVKTDVLKILFKKIYFVLKWVSKIVWFVVKETGKIAKELVFNKRSPDFYYKKEYPHLNNKYINYSKKKSKTEIKNKLYKSRNKKRYHEKTK